LFDRSTGAYYDCTFDRGDPKSGTWVSQGNLYKGSFVGGSFGGRSTYTYPSGNSKLGTFSQGVLDDSSAKLLPNHVPTWSVSKDFYTAVPDPVDIIPQSARNPRALPEPELPASTQIDLGNAKAFNSPKSDIPLSPKTPTSARAQPLPSPTLAPANQYMPLTEPPSKLTDDDWNLPSPTLAPANQYVPLTEPPSKLKDDDWNLPSPTLAPATQYVPPTEPPPTLTDDWNLDTYDPLPGYESAPPPPPPVAFGDKYVPKDNTDHGDFLEMDLSWPESTQDGTSEAPGLFNIDDFGVNFSDQQNI